MAQREKLEALKASLEESVREKSAAAERLNKSVEDKQRLLEAAFKKIRVKEEALRVAVDAQEKAAAEAERQRDKARWRAQRIWRIRAR